MYVHARQDFRNYSQPLRVKGDSFLSNKAYTRERERDADRDRERERYSYPLKIAQG